MTTVRDILASHPSGISRAGVLAWARLRIDPDFPEARLDAELAALGGTVVDEDGFLSLRRPTGARRRPASTARDDVLSATSSTDTRVAHEEQLDLGDDWSFHKGFGLGVVASTLTVAAYVLMLIAGARYGSAPRLEASESVVLIAVAAGAWLICGAIAGWSIGDRACLGGYTIAVVLFGVFMAAGGFDLGEILAGTDIPQVVASLGIATTLAVAGLYGYRIGRLERVVRARRESQVDDLEDEGWPAANAEAAMREWEHEAATRGLWPETTEYWTEAAAWFRGRRAASDGGAVDARRGSSGRPRGAGGRPEHGP